MVKSTLPIMCGFVLLFVCPISAADVQYIGRPRQTVSPEVKARAAEMSSRLAQLKLMITRLGVSHLRFRTIQNATAWDGLLSDIDKYCDRSSKTLSQRPFIDRDVFNKLIESAYRLGTFMGIKVDLTTDAKPGSAQINRDDVSRQKRQEAFERNVDASKEAVESAEEQFKKALQILKEIEERQSQNVAAMTRI
jgi:hypothetical protein